VLQALEDEELPGTHRRILELLREHGTLTVEELASRLQVRPTTVRKYALELEKRGLVVRLGRRVTLARREERREAEPFYLVKPGSVGIVAVRSLRQLAALLHYDLADEEAVSYALRGGYLAAWMRHVLGEKELARRVEELRDLEPREALERLRRLLQPYL
jgi:predicted ArsR family transcriptional regulator